MNAERMARLESLLKSADRPAKVSRGMRHRVLQAASQASVKRTRFRHYLASVVAVVLLACGMSAGVMQLVQHASAIPLFARETSHPASYELPIPAAVPSATGISVPVEWRLVDSVSAVRESRGRAFGVGLWE